MQTTLVRVLVVAIAGLALLGGAAFATERIPARGADAIITACAKKNGQIRIVPSATACRQQDERRQVERHRAEGRQRPEGRHRARRASQAPAGPTRATQAPGGAVGPAGRRRPTGSAGAAGPQGQPGRKGPRGRRDRPAAAAAGPPARTGRPGRRAGRARRAIREAAAASPPSPTSRALPARTPACTGTIAISFDAAGHATLTCTTTGPPPPPPSSSVRVNELATGTTGAAADEFVELYNPGTTAVDIARLEGRLPLGRGHLRHDAGDDPGRHHDRAGRLLPPRRQRLRRHSDGRPVVRHRPRRHGRRRRRSRRDRRARRQRRLGHRDERARRGRCRGRPAGDRRTGLEHRAAARRRRHERERGRLHRHRDCNAEGMRTTETTPRVDLAAIRA